MESMAELSRGCASERRDVAAGHTPASDVQGITAVDDKQWELRFISAYTSRALLPNYLNGVRERSVADGGGGRGLPPPAKLLGSC